MSIIKAHPTKACSVKHETHRSVIVRFVAILSIFIVYFVIISAKYGLKEGFLIAWLSWSFFVLSTPIADAGMLIDFPVRLVSGVKMIITETIVWAIAIGLNIYVYTFNPEIYSRTQLLRLFHHLLSNPWPLWLIIIVSAVGTFLSVRLGDELLDVIKRKKLKLALKHGLKLKLLYMAFVLAISFLLYDYLLIDFGLKIPL